MRLRNIRGSREAIIDSEFVIKHPGQYKNNWKNFWENENPIQIEIGMGKGKFLMDSARTNPEINYIGIEKYSSVLFRALEKMNEEALPNIRFIRMDAVEIEEIFGEEEIDKIFLNFSDPWPKEKHAKRRLTSKEFFSRYDKMLKAAGTVEFKTDNNSLFEFSLEEIPLAGWRLEASTRDLHNSSLREGNIMTEYEEKFSMMGNPINKLIVSR